MVVMPLKQTKQALSYSKVFQFLSKVLVLMALFAFFQFCSVVCSDGKVHYSAGSLFFLLLSLGLVVWARLDDPFVSQNPRGVSTSHTRGQIPCCAYTICSYCSISIFAQFPVDHLAHSFMSSFIFFLR